MNQVNLKMESTEGIKISPEDEQTFINNFIQSETNDESYLSADCLNIAVIGKTGAGKSSFINAFRGLKYKDGLIDNNIAKQGAPIKGVQLDVLKAKYEYEATIGNIKIMINFFDSMGFMDTENTSIEDFLNKIKDYYKIKEFDAIIFVSKERISDNEMSIAKLYEKTLLFFIYNQIDEYFEKEIALKNGSFNKKKSFNQQYEENRDYLIGKLHERETELIKLIDEKKIFANLLSDIEKFISKNLKCNEYKEKLIRKSIYLITSNAEDFCDPIYSRDGERIKREIGEHLARSKLVNLNINLLDPFSDRLIYMKKKFILKNVFDGTKKKLKVAGNGVVNVIPFLDTLIGNIPFIKKVSSKEIKETFRTELMQKFGIHDLKEKLTNNPNSSSTKEIEFDEIKITKLKKVMEIIENDEVIKSIDSITELTETADSSNIKEKLKDMINKILPTIGIGMAGLADDIALKLGPWALNISKTAFTGLAVSLFVISIPVSVVLYAYLLEIALEKILLRYEEYALLLFEIIHN